ncbi:hypothetical protein [Anaeromyxobacter sp. Fw109-5]|uniref:hypothetical protein n=1 Tax=Anaeromyxobacter sp. (strain Fw109-5) TaxID=404589 RepID=UPI0002D771F9|nr:hypothetical protein [Anaeromyxobacter sp. Fw109-5]
MTTFHVLAALFGIYMLARHAPRAVRLLRSPGHRAAAAIPLVNIFLAMAILAFAVKGLAASLIPG